MKSIRMSKKHGLNPAIPVCFFCGKEKGEVALLGALKGDAEAPRNLILDYEPCDSCREAFSKGVLIVGVSEHAPDGRPPIAEGFYPTGSYVVASKDFIKRAWEPEKAEEVLRYGKCLMHQNELEALQEMHQKACEEDAG